MATDTNATDANGRDAIHCVRNRPQQNRATGANGINVRFVNGAGFRLTMDMFSFSNINGGDIPGTDFLIRGRASACPPLSFLHTDQRRTQYGLIAVHEAARPPIDRQAIKPA